MIKLELPASCKNYENIIDACCNNMRVKSLYKFKIMQNKSGLIRISNSYIKWARVNFLFKYQYCKLEDYDLIKIGNCQIANLLTNKEMSDLYDNYFSKKDKVARKYYEEIINNAKNPNIQCPFCGGIGEPNELDHFLPKSGFGLLFYFSLQSYSYM